MTLNISYMRSLIALLKVGSIIFLIVAFGNGFHGYLSSEYNKNCREGITPQPPTSKPPQLTSTKYSSTKNPTPSPSTNSFVSTKETTTTEKLVVTLWPGESNNNEDKIPILWMERFHIIITVTCATFSFVLLALHLLRKELEQSPIFKAVDFGFHFSGAIFLMVGSIFMIYSATKINSMSGEICTDSESCQLLKEKLASAAFSFIAAIVYLGICIKMYGKKFYQTV